MSWVPTPASSVLPGQKVRTDDGQSHKVSGIARLGYGVRIMFSCKCPALNLPGREIVYVWRT